MKITTILKWIFWYPSIMQLRLLGREDIAEYLIDYRIKNKILKDGSPIHNEGVKE